jgi:hypothetical protein
MPTITTSTPIKVSGTFTGTRTNDYFKVTIPAGTEPGNFAVAVKDASDHILWSWHLWVTNYEPDKYDGSGWTTLGNYTVPGGQVQSYDGAMWQSGGALYGKVMMDRDLGSIADSYSAAVSTAATKTSRGQLYYQFGRKDPFPAAGLSTIPRVPGPVTIATSVNNPTTWYTYIGNWTSDADGTDYLWNDPNVLLTSGAKSIYDPCPIGWRLPLDGTWNDFSTATFFWQDSPVGRVYNNSTVFYATVGYRVSNTSVLGYIGTIGSYWSASPYSGVSGQGFDFVNTSIAQQSHGYRAIGIDARCSQE